MSAAVLENLSRLPAGADVRVADELVDTNGHMSLPHYVSAGVRAVWDRMLPLGLADERERGFSLFVAEQHSRFMGELLFDDTFAVHTAMIDRAERALHTVSYIVDRSRRRLACRLENVHVFVSTETRTSHPFPSGFAARLDAAIRDDEGLVDRTTLCPGLWRRERP